MIDYFERVLRFRELEVWDIRIGNDIYRMIIFDENRQAEIDDLNLPNGTELSEDELRKNLITVKVYSTNRVLDEHITPLDQFSKQLTNHIALAHCDVVVTFYTDEIEGVLDRLLMKKFKMKFDEIPLRRMWHLNQN